MYMYWKDITNCRKEDKKRTSKWEQWHWAYQTQTGHSTFILPIALCTHFMCAGNLHNSKAHGKPKCIHHDYGSYKQPAIDIYGSVSIQNQSFERDEVDFYAGKRLFIVQLLFAGDINKEPLTKLWLTLTFWLKIPMSPNVNYLQVTTSSFGGQHIEGNASFLKHILTENPTITINTDVMIKINIKFLTFAR